MLLGRHGNQWTCVRPLAALVLDEKDEYVIEVNLEVPDVKDLMHEPLTVWLWNVHNGVNGRLALKHVGEEQDKEHGS